MAADSYEYAIKRDVRNNPIVRELDRERHREMWRSAGTGVFVVLVFLFAASQHFAQLQQGYEIEAAQTRLARELERNRQLTLAVEELSAPARIEAIALDTIGMVRPGEGEAIVIERFAPPAAPADALARR